MNSYCPTAAVMNRSGLKLGLLARRTGSRAWATACRVAASWMLSRMACAMATKSFRVMVCALQVNFPLVAPRKATRYRPPTPGGTPTQLKAVVQSTARKSRLHTCLHENMLYASLGLPGALGPRMAGKWRTNRPLGPACRRCIRERVP